MSGRIVARFLSRKFPAGRALNIVLPYSRRSCCTEDRRAGAGAPCEADRQISIVETTADNGASTKYVLEPCRLTKATTAMIYYTALDYKTVEWMEHPT